MRGNRVDKFVCHMIIQRLVRLWVKEEYAFAEYLLLIKAFLLQFLAHAKCNIDSKSQRRDKVPIIATFSYKKNYSHCHTLESTKHRSAAHHSVHARLCGIPAFGSIL